MRSVVILGTGPLPLEGDAYYYGSSSRTWHFTKGLLDAGHRVHVIAFRPMRTEDGKPVPDEEHRIYSEGNLTLDSVDAVRHFYNDGFLRERIRQADPDVLIGVNVFASTRTAFLKMGLPFWADLNGFNMGEVQIRAHLTGDDSAIPHGWNEEWPALRYADVFSACSGPQRYAVIGELGVMGRLRASTCGYEFVYVIPEAREELPPNHEKAEIRKQLGPEAFLALWVGCYNFQFDVDSLFEGLETALAENPKLHFVSTGGKVDGHNETTFTRFRARVASSRHKDRYHFLGWVSHEEFDRLLQSSDVGVTLDLPCYETELGARNRLTEMLRAGLPPIATGGPEIAEVIRIRDAGWILPLCSSDRFAAALLEASSNREEVRRRSKNARQLFSEKYTLKATLLPLLEWVENPWFAPDHDQEPIVLEQRPIDPGKPASSFLGKLKKTLLGPT